MVPPIGVQAPGRYVRIRIVSDILAARDAAWMRRVPSRVTAALLPGFNEERTTYDHRLRG